MNYNDVKRIILECPALSGLDEVSQAFLLRHGDEIVLNEGDIIYGEGTELDDSFCVLLCGSVAIERRGTVVAESSQIHVFGDMAYFSQCRERTATVRATSPKTSVLKIHLRRADLALPVLGPLKKFLAVQPWQRPVD